MEESAKPWMRSSAVSRSCRPVRMWRFAILLLLTSLVLLPGRPVWSAGVIYVKVLVDDNERTSREAWRRRLKDRVDAASEIIHQYCNVRFAVAEFGVWNSDDRIQDLNKSLREFEQEVPVGPKQLAIGFSSQYRFVKGRNGLGGTRGPLHTHILVRESSPSTQERDRLEALVHELGHFLGAAHSNDPNSAMRPVIGDGRARSSAYRIGFDPTNAKIIQLVGTEVSALGVRRFHQLSDVTRTRLLTEYRLLAAQLPRDPAAKRFIQFIERSKPFVPAIRSGPRYRVPAPPSSKSRSSRPTSTAKSG